MSRPLLRFTGWNVFLKPACSRSGAFVMLFWAAFCLESTLVRLFWVPFGLETLRRPYENGLAYLVDPNWVSSRARLLCHFEFPSVLKIRSDDPGPGHINKSFQRWTKKRSSLETFAYVLGPNRVSSRSLLFNWHNPAIFIFNITWLNLK